MSVLPPSLRTALTTLSLSVGLAITCAAPLAAQQGDAGGNAQMIDLGPALTAPEPGQRPAAIVNDIRTAPQSTEVGTDTLLTVPEYTRGAAPLADGDDGDAAFGGVLIPLQPRSRTLAGIIRMTGEVQSEDFFVDLPVTSSSNDLVLSYRNAINVLPDESQLRIRLNGTDLAPVSPNAFEGFKTITLPSELLIAGRNEINITVHQAHRIFCGPEATFAIWTEINTNTSGVRLRPGTLPDNAVGLRMALSAQVAAAGSLPVQFSGEANKRVLDELAPRLAGLRDGSPVVLQERSVYGVLESATEMARITVLPGSGAPSVEIRRAADGAMVLVLTEGLDGSLPNLEELLPMPGPVANSAELEPGVVTTLRELQFTNTDAYNRYSEQQVSFSLPYDWLILASQKAQVRLIYRFSDGLPKGALMLVKMNDTTVQLLPLDQHGGDFRPTLEIDFPARLMVPGANALTFAAIIPGDPPEENCPPLLGPLLTISDDTTIYVPPSPRMQVLELQRPLISIRPDQVNLEDQSAADDAKADALLATVSAALRPIAQSERLENARLTVAYGAGLGRLDLEHLGITRRDLNRVITTAPRSQTERSATSVTQRSDTTGGLTARLNAIATWFVRLAVPGDGPLGLWLNERQADALLFIPRDDLPEELWFMVNPDADLGRVAAILAQTRLSPDGPKGRFSILTPEGKWENWNTSQTAPILLEPLTPRNFRAVAGNFASWSPLYFSALLFAMTFVSACFALIYIVTTRGKGKR